MKKRSWDEISEQFDQQWVELIDYDWDETEPYPSGGVVRVHAANRKEFDRLILQDPPKDSALVYVGTPKRSPNEILNFNMRMKTQ